jgi:hypothetical protein
MVKTVWNVVMAILYIAIGSFFFFWGNNMNNLPKGLNYTFGILMLVYGAFRAYRVINEIIIKLKP